MRVLGLFLVKILVLTRLLKTSQSQNYYSKRHTCNAVSRIKIISGSVNNFVLHFIKIDNYC